MGNRRGALDQRDHRQRVSEKLVQAYVEQVFQVRHSRQPRLDTSLSCGLTAPPNPPATGGDEAFHETFNAVQVCFPWRDVAPEVHDLRITSADRGKVAMTVQSRLGFEW